MRLITMCLWLTLAALLAAPALADSACTAGNYSVVVGTTCDIGQLQFTFTNAGFTAGYTLTNLSTGSNSFQPLAPSDLYFTPEANGFTLSLVNGPLTISPPAGFQQQLIIDMDYNLLVLGGYLTDETVSSPGFLSGSYDAYGWITGCTVVPNGWGKVYQGTTFAADSSGVVTTSSFVPYPCGSGPEQYLAPGSSATGNLFPVFMSTTDTAYWSGSTTFTFTTVASIPEPDSLAMVAIGLAFLAATELIRRRLPLH